LRTILLVAVGLLALVWWQAGTLGPVWVVSSPDSATYMAGAKSLATGRGYVDLSGMPIALAPPGTSLLYAPAAWLGAPADYTWFNATTLVMRVSIVALLFAILRPSCGAGLAGGLAIAVAFFQDLLSPTVMSDIPYLMILGVTLWVATPERLARHQQGVHLLLGLLLGFGCETRRTGYCVALAYTVFLMTVGTTRRNLVMVAGGAALAGVAGLALAGSAFVDGQAYRLDRYVHRHEWVEGSPWVTPGDLLERMHANAHHVFGYIGAFVTNDGRGATVAGLVMVGLCAVGAWRSRTPADRLHTLLIACYGIPLLLGEVVQPRYILPLLPSLLHCLGRVLIRLGPRRSGLIVLAFVGLSGDLGRGLAAERTATHLVQDTSFGAVRCLGHEGFQKLVQDHSGYLHDGVTVSTSSQDILRHLVPPGVRLRGIAFDRDPQRVLDSLQGAHPDYVFLDLDRVGTEELVLPAVDGHPELFKLLARGGRGRIYQTVSPRPER
jgi:hypothetical protein